METLKDSVDRFVLSLEQSEAELQKITHRLETEFGERFKRQAADPFSVVQRLHKVSRELITIRSTYALLASARTELLKEASGTLIRTTEFIQKLESKAGRPPTDPTEDDGWQLSAYAPARSVEEGVQ